MEISERLFDDIVILDLKGKIVLGEGDAQLRENIQEQLGKGRHKIVLNLAEVPYMDSAGLGEMVRSHTTVSRDGGKVKLLNCTARIKDLLTITKLITVFDHYDSEEDAIRSFS